MSTHLIASGHTPFGIERALMAGARKCAPKAIGAAVAYVSNYGVKFLDRLCKSVGIDDVRLVTDIGDRITHPEALSFALDAGWDVRVCEPATGTFHPKMFIGGDAFAANDELQQAKFLFMGSANLSRGGLKGNVECSLMKIAKTNQSIAARTFKAFWLNGTTLTAAILDQYAVAFERRNRARPPKDLGILGVSDDYDITNIDHGTLKSGKRPSPDSRSIKSSFATAAWAGLDSFTGQYRFQVEFPRDAGEILRRIIGASGSGTSVNLSCEDGSVRACTYRYYDDNSMFRLNVPNDVPNVNWVRDHKSGIAVVELREGGTPPLQLKILKPGPQFDDTTMRSLALGTWGKTTKRLYGWY